MIAVSHPICNSLALLHFARVSSIQDTIQESLECQANILDVMSSLGSEHDSYQMNTMLFLVVCKGEPWSWNHCLLHRSPNVMQRWTWIVQAECCGLPTICRHHNLGCRLRWRPAVRGQRKPTPPPPRLGFAPWLQCPTSCNHRTRQSGVAASDAKLTSLAGRAVISPTKLDGWICG